jgi:hypothetical protein
MAAIIKAEITIKAKKGKYSFVILEIDNFVDETFYEVSLIHPRPLDVASATSFKEAYDEIMNYFVLKNIDL